LRCRVTSGLSRGAGPKFKLSLVNLRSVEYDSHWMNDRASPDPKNHPQRQLLPWYVSGTLNPLETRQVTMHLAHCQMCRMELESLTLMRRVVRESFTEPRSRVIRRTVARSGVVLLISLQLAVIFHLWPTRPVPAATPIRPQVRTTLRFLPNPDASARMLEEFLRNLAAQIAGGPDGDGSYRVEIPTTDPKQVAATLAALQSHPEIAEHASVANDH
jgi:hypothetical protein